MRAKALTLFKDLKEGVVRKKGDAFNVSEERFREINSTRYGKLIEEAEEEVEELTVKQLKEALDEKGIEYGSKARKTELIELLK